MRFTQQNIDCFKVPNSGKTHTEWDDELREFGVQFQDRAIARYVIELRIDTKPQIVSLGRTDRISVHDARNIAEHILAVAQLAQKRLREATPPQKPLPAVTPPKADAKPRQSRMLRFSELASVHGITYSRRHVRRLEDEGRFPQRVNVGDRLVRWVESEIEEFLAKKIAERNTRNYPR